MSQESLKIVLKRICELQPSYSSENAHRFWNEGKHLRQLSLCAESTHVAE